jgi:hypothetical protein
LSISLQSKGVPSNVVSELLSFVPVEDLNLDFKQRRHAYFQEKLNSCLHESSVFTEEEMDAIVQNLGKNEENSTIEVPK